MTGSNSNAGKRKKPTPSHSAAGTRSSGTEQSGSKLLQARVLILALAVGGLHSWHVGSLFENQRHFSHLSTMERELSFRTEMGLYYSYFKTIVEADSLSSGVYSLYRNNLTEYPLVINTLKRFNLYPELVAGALYRALDSGNLISQTCWVVNRGEAREPVESCEGLKDPANFYVTVVWLCSGFTVAVLFMIGYYISDSLVGGLLSVISFFYNHGECTRVMWTPPLRESFAFPICLLQILMISVATRNTRPGWKNIFGISASTTAFIICWQFAQFMLFTQASALFFLYVVGILNKETLSSITISLVIGLLHSVALMFGNEMLFTSWLFSGLASILVVTLLLHTPLELLHPLVRAPVQILLYLLFAVGAKFSLAHALIAAQDDAHVFELLKSKFSDFKSFHTMLYTCSVEFDFLGWEMPWKTTVTLLLPSVLLAVSLFCVHVGKTIVTFYSDTQTVKEKHRCPRETWSIDPAVSYNILQMVAYAVMAILIMRLKLFFTPHLCILTALLASSKYVKSFNSREMHLAAVAVLIALMSVQGVQNVNEQIGMVGEFSDPQLEDLFEWIIKKTKPTAVFAGPMPLMANLLLSTRRPIVNHPHYEDSGLRERTKKVYSMFSRRSVGDVYKVLSDMKVNYVILHYHWCLTTQKDGCSMTELWDHEEPDNTHREPICPVLWKTTSNTPFKTVYKSEQFRVLALTPRKIELPMDDISINRGDTSHTSGVPPVQI